jgi:O-6-methylguanine DNA methyltransferase
MKRFDERVWEACEKIPKGKVSTYAQIARAIGNGRAARAVGNALNKNPDTHTTPCHRVVRSDGSVGGYAGGTARKIKLLAKERVPVSLRGKVELEKYFFKL